MFRTQETMLTDEGGLAIRLYNRTGVATVKGTVVTLADNFVEAFTTLNAANSNAASKIGSQPAFFGVVLESGIANGSKAWIVVSGVARVVVTGDVYDRDIVIVNYDENGVTVTGNTPNKENYFGIGSVLYMYTTDGITYSAGVCLRHY